MPARGLGLQERRRQDEDAAALGSEVRTAQQQKRAAEAVAEAAQAALARAEKRTEQATPDSREEAKAPRCQ